MMTIMPSFIWSLKSKKFNSLKELFPRVIREKNNIFFSRVKFAIDEISAKVVIEDQERVC